MIFGVKINSQLSQSAKLVDVVISTGMLCACLTVSAGGDPSYQKPELDEITDTNTQSLGPLEGQTLILDTEGLIDEDGIGQLHFQWQIQETTGRWSMVDEGTSIHSPSETRW